MRLASPDLGPALAPIHQCLEGVVIELTCQASDQYFSNDLDQQTRIARGHPRGSSRHPRRSPRYPARPSRFASRLERFSAAILPSGALAAVCVSWIGGKKRSTRLMKRSQDRSAFWLRRRSVLSRATAPDCRTTTGYGGADQSRRSLSVDNGVTVRVGLSARKMMRSRVRGCGRRTRCDAPISRNSRVPDPKPRYALLNQM